jgi:Fic family protein
VTSGPALLELLAREPTADDVDALGAFARRIAREGAALESAAHGVDADALTRARIASSNTLEGRRRERAVETEAARAAWRRANAQVIAWLEADRPLTLEAISELNALLRGEANESAFRASPIFIDLEPCPAPEQVAALMAPMLAAVLDWRERHGPLFAAGLLYQWCISVHPFADANGRTARLVTDWFLGAEGLPPMSFSDPLHAFVAVHPAEPEPRGPRDAAWSVGTAVLHTLTVLRNQWPSPPGAENLQP